jgi:biopolymer transport protein ExbB/TolQ
MNLLSTLASFYKGGGVFMNFILATAVVVIAIAVERLIVILPAASLNSRKLMEDLVRTLTRGDVAAARSIAGGSSAPAAKVAQAMLHAGADDLPRLQAAGDGAATLALAPLSRRLPHLNLLANVSTLLGLLGTITGLITAFSAVGAADPSQRSAFLASGISTALNTTSFGLIVAVPTLLIQGYLAGVVNGIGDQVDEMIIRLSQTMSVMDATRGASPMLSVHSGPRAGAVSLPRRAAGPSGGAE